MYEVFDGDGGGANVKDLMPTKACIEECTGDRPPSVQRVSWVWTGMVCFTLEHHPLRYGNGLINILGVIY